MKPKDCCIEWRVIVEKIYYNSKPIENVLLVVGAEYRSHNYKIEKIFEFNFTKYDKIIEFIILDAIAPYSICKIDEEKVYEIYHKLFGLKLNNNMPVDDFDEIYEELQEKISNYTYKWYDETFEGGMDLDLETLYINGEKIDNEIGILDLNKWINKNFLDRD